MGEGNVWHQKKDDVKNTYAGIGINDELIVKLKAELILKLVNDMMKISKSYPPDVVSITTMQISCIIHCFLNETIQEAKDSLHESIPFMEDTITKMFGTIASAKYDNMKKGKS